MATRQKAQRAARDYGAQFLDKSTAQYFDIEIIAPRGKLFSANGCHCLVHHENKGFGPAAVREFWSDVVSRIRYGIEACTQPGCDVCSEGDGE